MRKSSKFHCKNCKCMGDTYFKNETVFCCGIIKQPKPKCDKWRLCILKDEDAYTFDLMVEELLTLSSILTYTLIKGCKKYYNINIKNKRRKKK